MDIHRTNRVPTAYGTRGTAEETSDATHFPGYLFEQNDIAEIKAHLAGMAKSAALLEFPVDERRVESLTGDQESSVVLIPDLEIPIFVRTVLVTGPPSGSSLTTEAGNSVTNPANNAIIANLGVLPAGLYQLSGSIELQGTVTATDANNMKFTSKGVTVETFQYPGVAGVYPITPITFTSDGTNQSNLKAAGAASGASAIYAGNLIATPVPAPFTLQLGSRVWALSLPSSGILTIATDALLLDRSDPRILTTTVPGNWSLEIMGWGDVRERRA